VNSDVSYESWPLLSCQAPGEPGWPPEAGAAGGFMGTGLLELAAAPCAVLRASAHEATTGAKSTQFMFEMASRNDHRLFHRATQRGELVRQRRAGAAATTKARATPQATVSSTPGSAPVSIWPPQLSPQTQAQPNGSGLGGHVVDAEKATASGRVCGKRPRRFRW
jgi:hypothetical protein